VGDLALWCGFSRFSEHANQQISASASLSNELAQIEILPHTNLAVLSSVIASSIKPKAITLLKEELHSFGLFSTAITDADPPAIKCTIKKLMAD
jgi:hypothetical protein